VYCFEECFWCGDLESVFVECRGAEVSLGFVWVVEYASRFGGFGSIEIIGFWRLMWDWFGSL